MCIKRVLIKQPIMLRLALPIHLFFHQLHWGGWVSCHGSQWSWLPCIPAASCLAGKPFSIFAWWSWCWLSLSMKPSPHFRRTVLRHSGTLPLKPLPPPPSLAPIALCLTTTSKTHTPTQHHPLPRSYNSAPSTTPTHPPPLFIHRL